MFVPGPGAVEVHLQLGPEAQWVPESVQVHAVRRDANGTVTDVILDVSGYGLVRTALAATRPRGSGSSVLRSWRGSRRRRPAGY